MTAHVRVATIKRRCGKLIKFSEVSPAQSCVSESEHVQTSHLLSATLGQCFLKCGRNVSDRREGGG